MGFSLINFLSHFYRSAAFLSPLKLALGAILLFSGQLGGQSLWADTPQIQELQRYQTELRPNESLKMCLERLRISDPDIYKAIQGGNVAAEMSAVKPGTPVKLKVDASGKVQSLRVPLPLQSFDKASASKQEVEGVPSEVTVLVFIRPNDNPKVLKAIHLPEKTQIRVVSKTSQFDGNFFNVMDRQEIPDAVSDQFVRMFSGSVNFSKDLMHQASFTMKYEVIYLDNDPIGTGKVLYGALNTTRNQFQAFWWRPVDGAGSYYSPSGEMLSALSWKTPILYSRKTSNFGMRLDPFTGNWANHQGVDIGAPLGTEVRATQQGTVKSVGYQGNYGNVVVIEHANGYETVYGHLSGFAKLSPHQILPQGALLGFVGSTGRSTGPHLHYELRKYGQAINPEQNFKSFNSNTQAQQLEGEELKQFVKFQNSLLSTKLASR